MWQQVEQDVPLLSSDTKMKTPSPIKKLPETDDDDEYHFVVDIHGETYKVNLRIPPPETPMNIGANLSAHNRHNLADKIIQSSVDASGKRVNRVLTPPDGFFHHPNLTSLCFDVSNQMCVWSTNYDHSICS